MPDGNIQKINSQFKTLKLFVGGKNIIIIKKGSMKLAPIEFNPKK